MALHRDIYWVGRQWAVTGYGVQACDQRQKGKFDIEASRLWEDGALESLRTERWLNVEDLEKALAVARKRYPEPPRTPAPVEKSASCPKHGDPEGRPQPVPQKFAMRVDGWPAKLVPSWRIRR
jgi:hypothetical protein